MTWKKGYWSVCEAPGRFWGSNRIKSSISDMASGDAFGMMIDRCVGTNCGKRKFICDASFWPSGQSATDGDPRTEQIL